MPDRYDDERNINRDSPCDDCVKGRIGLNFDGKKGESKRGREVYRLIWMCIIRCKRGDIGCEIHVVLLVAEANIVMMNVAIWKSGKR